MCKFESSQKYESRAKQVDAPEACREARACFVEGPRDNLGKNNVTLKYRVSAQRLYSFIIINGS